MLRTIVCASIALLLSAGLVVGQEKKKKGNFAGGVVKKIDAEKSTITVTVRTKDSMEDKEFKIGESAKFVVVMGEERKELSVKDGFKSELLKEGARVTIAMNDKNEVTTVTLGQMGKKKKDK
jgi:Cu/Ag efflux protein CusF